MRSLRLNFFFMAASVYAFSCSAVAETFSTSGGELSARIEGYVVYWRKPRAHLRVSDCLEQFGRLQGLEKGILSTRRDVLLFSRRCIEQPRFRKKFPRESDEAAALIFAHWGGAFLGLPKMSATGHNEKSRLPEPSLGKKIDTTEEEALESELQASESETESLRRELELASRQNFVVCGSWLNLYESLIGPRTSERGDATIRRPGRPLESDQISRIKALCVARVEDSLNAITPSSGRR